MLIDPSPSTLIHPQSRDAVLQLREIGPHSDYMQWQRLPYYSALWIQHGQGSYDTSFSTQLFAPQTLLSFAPDQPFRLAPDPAMEVRGVGLHFHPDFYCVEKPESEAFCNGLLFNTLSLSPAVQIRPEDVDDLGSLTTMIHAEMQKPALAQRELLAAYLKIFLIRAARPKAGQLSPAAVNMPFALQKLKDLIEQHYRQKHTPADYADLLHLSPKALGRLTRTHFQKTPTALIKERILMEAKRELYLSTRSIKEIAYALGFSDEYYFSRFFKLNTTVAPRQYRHHVWTSHLVGSPGKS